MLTSMYPVREGGRIVFHDSNHRENYGACPPSIKCCEVCGDPRFDEAGSQIMPLEGAFGKWVCPDPACEGEARRVAFRHWARKNLRELKGMLGVPALYLDLYRPPVYAVAARAEQLSEFDKYAGLLLFGAPGSGKSTLASAWLDMALPSAISTDGLHAGWVHCQRFLARIKESYDKGNTPDVMEHYCSPEVLVFDDLGTERGSDWSRSVLYELVDRRVSSLRFTVVTSTLDPHALRNLDPRLASRLALFMQVCLSDRDYRLEKETRFFVGQAVGENVLRGSWGRLVKEVDA